MTMINLDNTRVLVTAGASGIGRAIAALASESGARVAVCDIDTAALHRFRDEFPRTLALEADVTSEASVTDMIDQIKAAWGGLDFLVNNAGISGPTAAIEDIALSDWQAVLDVNLTGAFLCSRAVAPILKAQNHGGIINMSSVSGRIGVPQRSPYAASKWGVVGLTQTLARELGPFGIRANAVLPGFVEGERMERVVSNRAKHRGIPIIEMQQQYLNKVSMREFVSAQDVAEQVLFLLSPLSRHISGQSLGVCGNVEYL